MTAGRQHPPHVGLARFSEGAIVVNSVCVPSFVSTISAAEIHLVSNNVFKRCQSSLVARFSDQSVWRLVSCKQYVRGLFRFKFR